MRLLHHGGVLTFGLILFIGCSATSLAQYHGKKLYYSSCVNWDYTHRKDLEGWKYTAELIRESIRQWGIPSMARSVENQGIRRWQSFLKSSRETPAVYYLAGHQTRAGRMEMGDGTMEFFEKVFPDPAAANHPLPLLLILDACHADVVVRHRYGGMPPARFMLTASAASEETYELKMYSRRPLDFRRRYPGEVKWMRSVLGETWNGKVSYLGFLWTKCFLDHPQAPADTGEWREFLQALETSSLDMRDTRMKDLTSTLHLWER